VTAEICIAWLITWCVLASCYSSSHLTFLPTGVALRIKQRRKKWVTISPSLKAFNQSFSDSGNTGKLIGLLKHSYSNVVGFCRVSVFSSDNDMLLDLYLFSVLVWGRYVCVTQLNAVRNVSKWVSVHGRRHLYWFLSTAASRTFDIPTTTVFSFAFLDPMLKYSPVQLWWNSKTFQFLEHKIGIDLTVSSTLKKPSKNYTFLFWVVSDYS